MSIALLAFAAAFLGCSRNVARELSAMCMPVLAVAGHQKVKANKTLGSA
jgi:hypothetical protein